MNFILRKIHLLIKRTYGKRLYYFWLTFVFIGMIACLFLYFYIQHEKLSNMFGNAFAGCLTGLIIAALSNIKNREINFYDFLLKKYKELFIKADKIRLEIDVSLKDEEVDGEILYRICLLIVSFFNDIEDYSNELYSELDNDVVDIITQIRLMIGYYSLDGQIWVRDIESCIEKLKIFPDVLGRIKLELAFLNNKIKAEKNKFEKEIF